MLKGRECLTQARQNYKNIFAASEKCDFVMRTCGFVRFDKDLTAHYINENKCFCLAYYIFFFFTKFQNPKLFHNVFEASHINDGKTVTLLLLCYDFGSTLCKFYVLGS